MNPFNMYTTEELQAISLCLKAELKTRTDIAPRTKAGEHTVEFIINRQLYAAEIKVSKSVPQAPSDSNYKGNLLAQAVEMLTSVMSRSESEVVDILYVNRHFCQASEHRAKDAIEQAYKAHRETLPKKIKKGATRLSSVEGV